MVVRTAETAQPQRCGRIAKHLTIRKAIFSYRTNNAFNVFRGNARTCSRSHGLLVPKTQGSIEMEHTSYSIEKRQDQWVVWACGARVLVCKHKKMAIMIARRASNMLRESPASDASQPIADAHPPDQHSDAFVDLRPDFPTPTSISSPHDP